MRKNLIATSIAALVGGLAASYASAAVIPFSAAAYAAGAAGTTLAVGAITPVPLASDTLVTNNTGTGHFMVVPYFTTQGSNATLLNIVNTDTVNAKAVKVRFRGASNSDDIFDFQVYMSPGDVWTANISQDATSGLSKLTTADKSCVLPASIANSTGNNFITARLPTTLTATQLPAETREGYIEIFNMADIPKTLLNGQTANTGSTNNPLYDAIKHVAGVPPCFSSTTGAASLGLLTNEPANLKDATALGLSFPTGGLMANYTIINVANSLSYSGEAVTVSAVLAASGISGGGNIVFSPQAQVAVGQVGGPASAVAGASVNTLTADPLLRTTANYGAIIPATAAVAAQQFDIPDMSTPYVGAVTNTAPLQQAFNMSRAFETFSLTNEFLGDPSIGARTDWVLSMPTRRYNVAVNYASALTNKIAYTDYTNAQAGAGAALGVTNVTGTSSTAASIGSNPDGATAVTTTNNYFTTANTSLSGYQICVPGGANAVATQNREEVTPAPGGFVISPAAAGGSTSFCGETSVASWNAGSASAVSVLGAAVARQDITTTTGLDGWAKLTFKGATAQPTSAVLLNALTGQAAQTAGTTTSNGSSLGLPIIGRAFIKAVNGSQNFGVSYNHRYTR